MIGPCAIEAICEAFAICRGAEEAAKMLSNCGKGECGSLCNMSDKMKWDCPVAEVATLECKDKESVQSRLSMFDLSKEMTDLTSIVGVRGGAAGAAFEGGVVMSMFRDVHFFNTHLNK